MHDSIVTCFTWLPGEKRMTFLFEDMYANFVGLPEYPGRQSGAIALDGVSDLNIALETVGPLQVFEFLLDERDENVALIAFAPGGQIRVRFGVADYPPCRLATD